MIDQTSVGAGIFVQLLFLAFSRPGLFSFLPGFPGDEELFGGTLYLVILINACNASGLGQHAAR